MDHSSNNVSASQDAQALANGRVPVVSPSAAHHQQQEEASQCEQVFAPTRSTANHGSVRHVPRSAQEVNDRATASALGQRRTSHPPSANDFPVAAPGNHRSAHLDQCVLEQAVPVVPTVHRTVQNGLPRASTPRAAGSSMVMPLLSGAYFVPGIGVVTASQALPSSSAGRPSLPDQMPGSANAFASAQCLLPSSHKALPSGQSESPVSAGSNRSPASAGEQEVLFRQASKKSCFGGQARSPTSVGENTRPSPVSAGTRPSPVSAGTRPSPVSAGTRPSPVSAGTRPSPVSAGRLESPAHAGNFNLLRSASAVISVSSVSSATAGLSTSMERPGAAGPSTSQQAVAQDRNTRLREKRRLETPEDADERKRKRNEADRARRARRQSQHSQASAGQLRTENDGTPARAVSVESVSMDSSVPSQAVPTESRPETAAEAINRRRNEARRARRAAVRQSQNPEDIAQVEREREAERERISAFREREPEDQRRARQESDALATAAARSTETEEERRARQEANALTTALARSQESDEQRDQRLQSLRRVSQGRRSVESDQRRSERLQALRETQRIRQFQAAARNICLGRRVREADVHDIGSPSVVCVGCGALHFPTEVKPANHGLFSGCCKEGKVRVNLPYDTYPDLLQKLFTRQHPNQAETKNFHENIRKYNGMFDFASMEAKTVNFNGGGPYCYKVHGQIHHTLNLAVMADEQRNERPKYGQIFLLDTDSAVDCRFAHPAARSCNRNLVAQIETLLRRVNHIVDAYKMMFEVEQEVMQQYRQQNGTGRIPEIRLCFNTTAPDQNRYNLPRVNEVAAVFVSPDGNDAPPPSRLMMHPRGTQFRRLPLINKLCTPMTYPLFFANGGYGWEPKMRYVNATGSRQNMSLLEYYAFVIAERAVFSPILYGGRLFQQFLVDAFIKVEQERLQWQRDNQDTLRADNYIGLHDYLDRQAELQGVARGKTVILASSFHGGDRYYAQAYQDAMAIVREHGTPDLFVTFTCNSAWPEVVNNLKSGQTASDRPDLVAKVFKLKLDEFLNDIVKKGVLGKVRAYVRVIEFQKRGLPHVHMLLILEEQHKLRTAEEVDSLVWAELPDPVEFPRLHEIVKKMMMHGPCGAHNPRSPCMEKLKTRCSKRFPKDYSDDTILEENQIPRYRRRASAPHFIGRNGFKMDSQWVVPYNPYLSSKYNAHINVEVCTSVRCVKYLFKYIYKGHDKASVFISDTEVVVMAPQQQPNVLDHDEIKNYIDCRYVGAPEAAWRLHRYKMQEQSHHIERLAVHLPGEQMVYFRESETTENVMLRKEKQRSPRGLL